VRNLDGNIYLKIDDYAPKYLLLTSDYLKKVYAMTTIEFEQQCCRFARLMKSRFNYDAADGLDLMIKREKADDLNLNDVQPELKLAVSAESIVMVEWKKSDFDALELQYRKVGATMWQPADKITEKIIEFAPPLTTVGVPENFELRPVLLIKNERGGKRLPTYTLTVG